MKIIMLQAGQTHIQYDDMAHLIADALWPATGPDDERWAYFLARINLDVELKQAVTMRQMPVKDPLTFGPHTFPVGHALKSAQVTIDDLREYVAGRGITVVVGDAPEQAATKPQAAPVTAAYSGDRDR